MMCYISYISTLICLCFGLVHGNQCKVKDDNYKGCSLHKVGSETQCPRYSLRDNGEGKFVFYTKPIIKGSLSIRLYKIHNHNSNTVLAYNLFTITPDIIHIWYKITIKRGTARYIFCFDQCLFDTYFLEIESQDTTRSTVNATYNSNIEAGNLIVMDSVTSFWSAPCDQHQDDRQPPDVTLPQLPPTQPPSQSPQTLPSTEITNDECGKKYESEHLGCPVYTIESQNGCQTYLETSEREGNFVFYIKPLNNGELSISLYTKYNNSSNTKITDKLFPQRLDYTVINVWYKINITRSTKLYILEVNNITTAIHSNEIEAGDEIRVTTVTSLWRFPCDPGQEHIQSNPTEAHMPVWQLAIIGAVTSVLTLMIILLTVILILRHKRRKSDPTLTQPTDAQARLSRHVSENSLYESYDNRHTGENQVTHVMGPDAAAINSDNPRRDSAHNSENSLYAGFN